MPEDIIIKYSECLSYAKTLIRDSGILNLLPDDLINEAYISVIDGKSSNLFNGILTAINREKAYISTTHSALIESDGSLKLIKHDTDSLSEKCCSICKDHFLLSLFPTWINKDGIRRYRGECRKCYGDVSKKRMFNRRSRRQPHYNKQSKLLT